MLLLLSNAKTLLGEELEIKIEYKSNITMLGHLQEFARSLDSVNRLQVLTDSPKHAYPQPQIVRFEIKSPPVLSLLSEPDWLVLFVTVIASYEKLKDGVRSIVYDIDGACSKVEGLTQAEINELKGFVKLFIDNQLSRAEERANGFIVRVRMIRSSLGINHEDSYPNITVKKRRGRGK
jgi:hypothetical protein